MSYKVSIYPEPYAPSGNIGDGGLRKLLGAPSLNSLQMVLREAIQNSCDATIPGSGPTILIRIRTLNPTQINILKTVFFSDLPSDRTSKDKLLFFLNSKTPRVLEICDYQTLGLMGPTRADCVPPGTTQTNFINFMRNFGSNHDTQNRGGTYGFGKASLYQASNCETIIVNSLTTFDSTIVQRLMGCHLGLQHEKFISDTQVQRFTGRHWWGHKKHDDFVDPIEGPEALKLATEIGLPKRVESQTGTSIMILDPFIEHSTDVLAGLIQESLLWNFWPRLTLDTPKTKKIDFQIEIDGKPYTLPLPENFPPLDLYAAAIKKIRTSQKDTISIKRYKPAKTLGQLSLIKGIRGKRTPLTSPQDTLIPSVSCHIALMRPVELVVKYYEGNSLPDERVEWAGVFIADERVQHAFAKAEPPAHDDWQPKIIDNEDDKSYVTIALKRIKDEAIQFTSPLITVDQHGTSAHSLAAAAGAIGQILTSIDGQGGAPNRTLAPSLSIKFNKSGISNPTFIKIDSFGKKIIATFEVTVKILTIDEHMQIRATPMLAADGAALSEDTLLPIRPKVIDIHHKLNPALSTASDRLIIGSTSGTYEIRVHIPQGYATTLKVDLIGAESQ